jgi:hypothetical protein
MSVTFFDPANPTKYDDDYNEIGGTPVVNLSNVNARYVLKFLGLDSGDLCGQMQAQDLIRVVEKGIYMTNVFPVDDREYLTDALARLLRLSNQIALDNLNGKVHWC